MKSHSEIAREIALKMKYLRVDQFKYLTKSVASALSTAVQQEREACAKVAETKKSRRFNPRSYGGNPYTPTIYCGCQRKIASKIRQRGKHE